MPDTQTNYERTKELTDRLETGMKDLFQSDKYKDFLKTMSHFCEEVKQKKSTHKFKITGVVMDVGYPGMDFSLKPFCEEVFRTSELSQDRIVETIISNRV